VSRISRCRMRETWFVRLGQVEGISTLLMYDGAPVYRLDETHSGEVTPSSRTLAQSTPNPSDTIHVWSGGSQPLFAATCHLHWTLAQSRDPTCHDSGHSSVSHWRFGPAHSASLEAVGMQGYLAPPSPLRVWTMGSTLAALVLTKMASKPLNFRRPK
jgi:hypothetical protein